MVLDLIRVDVFCYQIVLVLVIFGADMSPSVAADNKKKVS